MKTKHRIIQWLALLALVTLNSQLSTALAQGTTAFTYQGQLRDGGTNANGAYTMIFKLYDAVTSGNQIGSAITNSPTLGNGLFTVNLNFGAGAFNGSARWLDITISNGGVTQTLSPRVQVLPAPYALYAAVAATVTNGAIMNAQLAGNAVNKTNIASGQVVKSLNGLTDYVILSAGTNVSLLTNGNTLKISAGIPSFSAGVPSFQIFTSSGTFVVPTNVTKIMVELWGGGGGGGSGYPFSDSDGTGDWTGGGGGAGGYGWNVFNVIPGNSYTVTTPADADGGVHGGTTSFGSLMSATGGSPGANATRSSTGSGGAGGISTGGVINFTSGSGFDGWRGGQGGGAWRGGGGSVEGPGSGGNGGNGNPGEGAGGGIVIVYY
jgi:hypothetical protein